MQPKHRDPELSLLSEYGRDFEVLTRGHLSRYLEAGLMKKEGTRYCLTPRGFLVSNAILADLIDWD